MAIGFPGALQPPLPVNAKQPVADLMGLYPRFQRDPDHHSEGLSGGLIFVSAPSKTGNNALIMVNGAHGLREGRLIVIAA
jgi:hypothetical protein